jgi:hypothetical protein
MKKKENTRIWWWLSLVVIAAAAILIGYFIGLERYRDEKEPVISQEPSEVVAPPSQPEEDPPAVAATPPTDTEDTEEEKTLKRVADCSEIANDMQEFFHYLDSKGYVQRRGTDVKTYTRFIALIKKLSSDPPLPAGEGIDTDLITKNIFHLFRVMNRQDLRLVKDIIRNEVDTLELNMDLFYSWVMGEGRCPEQNASRPSLDVLYQYAGFFLNSIGGRAYLFRRSLEFRLLVSYYCLLIIHEADKRGKNSYGIDVVPFITPIADEISLFSDFYFQNDYLEKLDSLKGYYLQTR